MPIHTKCSVCFTQNSDTVLRNQHLAPTPMRKSRILCYNLIHRPTCTFTYCPNCMNISFSILIQFSFPGTIAEFSHHLDSLDGFKPDKLSMGSRSPFMVWLFSLRTFLIFIYVVTIMTTTLFSHFHSKYKTQH